MSLTADYPWVKTPLVVSAPMLRIAGAPLAISVSRAGGLGFIAAGFDVSDLETTLAHAASLLESSPIPHLNPNPNGTLPVGVGFINWGADLAVALAALKKYPPAAVWLFGAPPESQVAQYSSWATSVRAATDGKTKIWIQVGSVRHALDLASSPTVAPDVLVIQGSDAGGHGLRQSSSIISLLPETKDSLTMAGHGDIPLIAAGGISDGRGLAAAQCLGADGMCMGTRFLASSEANIARGYQREVLRVADGGASTVRSTVYDRTRGIYDWPSEYDGRGVMNESFYDDRRGMSDEENKRLYEAEMKKGDEGWGPGGRMATYAGTGIGLVREVRGAGEIVEGVRREAGEILSR